jgi:putative Mg2+ transporter-C (MgtC) family protein
MLVGLGSALFMIALAESGASAEDLTRVAQGIAAGIGFIGGGVILKLESQQRVKGLTTAASIWLTSAVGIAAGVGRLGVAAVGIGLSLWILAVVYHWEIGPKTTKNSASSDNNDDNDCVERDG